ncbi:MAG: GTP cyclohydrolase II [Actinobacteria bacterium]|nr:GTP cyclohydrolase II [Actinomycetota bacterium]
MGFASIEEAIDAIGRGEIVVVVDDENRENEGDLVMAAQFATSEKVAFYVNHTSGLHATAFTVSVDVIEGTTTGISACDRAATLRSLSASSTPEAFSRPGHIFPLRARDGGVLKRAGHTEAAVDLARLAGCAPAGVICEIVREDGSMARLPDLVEFAERHELLLVSIADLVAHRYRTETLVRRTAEAVVQTRWAPFRCVAYESMIDGVEHVAMVYGDAAEQAATLVRVHSECLTGDVFGSRRCDCGAQLDDAMAAIVEEGAGVVVYLRGHEGRGIGIGHKIRAYSLQDDGLDTVDANLEQGLPVDSREYGIGAQILDDLGIRRLRLMTNNPAKYTGLRGYGLEVIERVAVAAFPTPENRRYLETKRDRMGHLIDLTDEPAAELGVGEMKRTAVSNQIEVN